MKVLAVDFDGTLCTTAWPEIGKRKLIHKLVASYVRYKSKHGWTIILNTLRDKNNKKAPMSLFYAESKCVIWDIPISFINDNVPVLTQKYGYARKIKADLYLDDHNIGLLGWLLRKADR
jgi:hypothetical protein